MIHEAAKVGFPAIMNVTYDLTRETKNALEDLKTNLRRGGLPAFECSIISFLVLNADLSALKAHFTALAKQRQGKGRRNKARREVSTSPTHLRKRNNQG